MLKKILLLSLLFCLLSNCASNPKPGPVAQQEQRGTYGVRMIEPCGDFSLDNDAYYTGVGHGIDSDLQNAKTSAWMNAQSEIKSKLGGLVEGLTTDYASTAGGRSGSATQRKIEGELATVIRAQLNDAEKTCGETYKNDRGAYEVFEARRVSKVKLAEAMLNRLSEIDELKVDFDRDQFRKYAAERMKAAESQAQKSLPR